MEASIGAFKERSAARMQIQRDRETIAMLVRVLEWFADPKNWREEVLSEGPYFSAEWRIGFDPRDAARAAIKKAALASAGHSS